MKDRIILIGPVGAGKTTISNALSERTGMKVCHVDDIKTRYFLKLGYSRLIALIKLIFKGEGGLYYYWKRFEAGSVQSIIEDHPNHIIDFGAGFSVYEDEELFHQVETVLKFHQNIILLRPSMDNDESINYLKNRTKSYLNEIFVSNRSNGKLAKYTVYTIDKSVNEICEEILKLIEIIPSS